MILWPSGMGHVRCLLKGVVFMKGFGGVIISRDPFVLLYGTQREWFSKKRSIRALDLYDTRLFLNSEQRKGYMIDDFENIDILLNVEISGRY